MNRISIAIISILIAASSLLAEPTVPTHNLALTVHSESGQHKDYVYKISKAYADSRLEGASFPISFLSKTCIFDADIEEQGEGKTISIRISDPSVIVPGNGTSSGHAVILLSITFPYAPGSSFQVYSGDSESISLQVSENKP